MTNPLEQIAKDFQFAADHGSEIVAHSAVQAGAAHANSGARELLNVEHITTTFNGESSASVVAEQPEGVMEQGPQLASSASIADAMAQQAVDVGLDVAMGKRS